MSRLLCVLALAFAFSPVVGCGGGAQKGKNADFDRPKAADTKKE